MLQSSVWHLFYCAASSQLICSSSVVSGGSVKSPMAVSASPSHRICFFLLFHFIVFFFTSITSIRHLTTAHAFPPFCLEAPLCTGLHWSAAPSESSLKVNAGIHLPHVTPSGQLGITHMVTSPPKLQRRLISSTEVVEHRHERGRQNPPLSYFWF